MSWPTDITVMDKGRTLEVAFDDGQVVRLTAERLRVESPSAEVQGHSPSQKRTLTGKENVAIVGIEPVGNYAIKIVFDDGHDTGLYSWDYLRKLASYKLCRSPGPVRSAENRARDVALEALERPRDFADVLHLAPMPPSRDNRGADAGRDNIGVRALQRRRSIVDHHAIIALCILRQRQKFLGAEQFLRVGRGCAGDEQRQAGHDVDRDRRQFGVAMRQGLDQALRLRIHAEQPGEPWLPQVCVDKESWHRHLGERQRKIGGEIGRPDFASGGR